MKMILAVNLGPEKYGIVNDICKSLEAVCVTVPPEDYDLTVGEFIEKTGRPQPFGQECEQSVDHSAGKPVSINMEMIIFAGLSDRELDIYIDRYKKSGAEKIPLKAQLTDTNVNWTIRRLYTELGREFLFYRMRGKA